MEFNKEIIKAISQVQEGKEEAFNKIYSYTYNFVYFRAKSIMKNDDEAWDLLQEVYIVAYKSISKLEKPENLYAWLGGIVYNLGMKAFRKKKDVLLDEENEGIFDTIRSTDKDIQPEAYIEEKQTRTIVKELIDQLPELQKVAVIAYYYDEMSVKDIANQFECSEGTIKSRLNYARQFLKKAAEDKEKKDGIKLHSITIPTIIVALRMLSEDTTVSAQAAQLAYNGVCSSIGLEATSINMGANLGSGALSATQAAGTATKATGIVAKFIGMTTRSQVLTVSLVTVISVSSILGGIALTNSINKESKNAINFSSPIEEVPVEPSITPTVQTETETETENETDKSIELSEEENTLFNLVIHGLTDSIESGYVKGDTLTDEQMMAIAYRVFYLLCVPEGNIFDYTETDIEYEAPDYEGDVLVSHAYLIPEEDINLLLNTLIGQAVSDAKNYVGFIYQYGHYYLIEACNYVGFTDFWKDDKAVSYNYRKSRKFDVVSFETTENKASQEGIREIGHSGADGVESITKSEYRIEFEAVESTKFGRYSLVSFQSSEQEMIKTVSIEANNNFTVNELMQNYLKEHVTEVSEKYSNYDYSEYFIYDWNKMKTPILIIRDILNNDEKSSIYSDLHYIESKNHLENYGQSISGAWDSIFYKKDYSFIVVIDDNFDESESHAAYFYGDGDLKGFDTMAEAEELWFWYKNNGITAFLDLDTYKSKREEVEQLEKIIWYKCDDLTPFR